MLQNDSQKLVVLLHLAAILSQLTLQWG